MKVKLRQVHGSSCSRCDDRHLAARDCLRQGHGGAASVPMRASCVQTGATVSAGKVRGAVQVLLDYQ